MKATERGPITPSEDRHSGDRGGTAARSRRQEAILELLASAGRAIPGGELARRLGVSRQVIVQDVAVLRAGGREVLATPAGYLLPRAEAGTVPARDVLAVRHPPERTVEELNTLVDHGLRVVDVLVEHPLYGELRGHLMLENREDVRRFWEQVENGRVALLSILTDGLHYHTVEARDVRQIERARQALARLGLLAEGVESGTG